MVLLGQINDFLLFVFELVACFFLALATAEAAHHSTNPPVFVCTHPLTLFRLLLGMPPQFATPSSRKRELPCLFGGAGRKRI